MTSFIIYVLACVGAHRLWNFESVFQGARNYLLRFPYLKPLTCQACNAFWVALTLALCTLTPASYLLLQTLAAYAIVRGVLWVYQMASHSESWLRIRAIPGQMPPAVLPAVSRGNMANPPAAPAGGCTSCEAKKAQRIAQQADMQQYARRVVLLTTLADFNPSYSLTSVILDQARMLARDPSWLVQVWVNEHANLSLLPTDLPKNVEVRSIVPQVAWRPDVIDPVASSLLQTRIRSKLIELGNATVISHDLLFVSSYTTFAAAIHVIGNTKGFAWLHVAHSAVGPRPEQSSQAVISRTNLPPGHKLLCLNESLVDDMAAYYATSTDNIMVCPNPRDVTTFGSFDPKAAQLVRDHRLDEADVVQIFPLSVPRMEAKGIFTVIDILGRVVTDQHQTVRLVLVTAHANGAREQLALSQLREYAVRAGLPADSLVITREDFPDTAAYGLSQGAVKDLFSVSNLFIFPTISEASSLVLTEAALAGCLLVTNQSVPALATIVPDDCVITRLFGSERQPRTDPVNTQEIAFTIWDRLTASPANMGKRHVLRTANYRTVGARLQAIVSALQPQ